MQRFTITQQTPNILASNRLLGIDPGSQITGYGLITDHPNRPGHIASGSIRLTGKTLEEKLYALYLQLQELITTYQPTEMAIEQVFYHKNVQSAFKLAQARAIPLLVAGQYALPVSEYTPRAVKQAVTGYGAADKLQIQKMVASRLQIADPLEADAADALAIALCHCQTRSLNVRLTQAIKETS